MILPAFILGGRRFHQELCMADRKILVVDDDKRLRDLLQRYLGEQGFFVRTIESFYSGRRRYKKYGTA